MSVVKRQRVSTNLINHFDDEQPTEFAIEQGIWLKPESSRPTLTAAFSPSSARLASAGLDQTVSLWNLPGTEPSEPPNYGTLPHRSAVTGLVWPDEDRLVTACADSSLNWWDLTTHTKLRRVQECHTCPGGGVINQIASLGGTAVVSVGDDGCASVWDETTSEAISTIETDFPLTTVAVSGTTVYVSGLDPTVLAYDWRKPSDPLWTYSPGPSHVTSLCHNGVSSLFIRSADGGVQQINSAPFVPQTVSRKEGSFTGVKDSQSYLVRCDVHTERVISGGEGGLAMWDLGSRKLVKRFEGPEGTRSVMVEVGFNPSGSMVYGTLNGGGVCVWTK